MTTPLSDYIKVTHGYAFPGEDFTEEPTGDLLLTPGNFAIGGGFQMGKGKYFRGDVPPEYVLPPGELVVTMTDLSKQSDTLGYPALVPSLPGLRILHNQRIGRVVFKSDNAISKRFLYYVMCTQGYRHEVLASATGTGVKHTAPTRIEAYKFDFPPLPEQHAIASVLGSLDDKIEQNRRAARGLERLARVIFRAWFVEFEPVQTKAIGASSFPSMPQAVFDTLPTTFTNSDLGPVPERWDVAVVSEMCEVNPPRPLRKGVLAPCLEMKYMPTHGHAPDAWEERPFSAGTRFTNGDTLVARITPCLENGKTAFVDFLQDGQVAWGSTEYIVLRPKPPLPPEFAYCLARTSEFRNFAIQNMTGTSGRQRVAPTAMDHFRLAVPPEDLAIAFGEIVQPLFDRIRVGMDETRKLAALRDYLLPQLLNGQISVQSPECAEAGGR